MIITGIYKLTNKINGKVYIGQSTDVYYRYKQHKYNANKKNNRLYITKIIKKYGINAFDFEVLEECDEKRLDEKEIYWIYYYDSIDKGYNRTDNPDGFPKGKYHYNYNHTHYYFQHKNGEIFYGTTCQLRKKYSVSYHINEVIYGNRLSSDNWGLRGWTNKLKNKKKAYVKFNFKHDSGLEEYCTANELKKKYNLTRSVYKLISGDKERIFGWSIIS